MNRAAHLNHASIDHCYFANRKRVTAEVISCPGQLVDDTYCAVQINIEGFESPYVLTLALRAVGYRALSQQTDPAAVYGAIAAAINDAHVAVELTREHLPAAQNAV